VLVDDSEAPALAAESPAITPASPTTEPDMAEEEQAALPNSVAVLPLDNLSPDPDNAYFAAGMHEEILNYLAKLRNLNVISRTSVTRYEDSELSVPEIAAELNVETVMEGSVRYAGDQVRVTLQLIDPLTDAHLWSDAYDGDLSDVFAIQADIAMNVANALEAEFSLEEQQSIEKVPTTSQAAYTLYLRAIDAWWNGQDPMADLDRAIEIDPEFGEAYARRALYLAYASAPTDERTRFVIENAETALDLDPTLGLAHLALAVLYQGRWQGAEALESLRRAYALAPNDPEVLIIYAQFNRYTDNVSEAVEANIKAAALDPNSSGSHSQLGASFRQMSMYDEAAEAYERAIELSPSNLGNHTQFATLQAVRDRPEDALRELELAEVLLTPDAAVRRAQMAGAYARVGRPDDARRMFDQIAAIDRDSPVGDVIWGVAYLTVGDHDEAYARLTNAIENQIPNGLLAYSQTRIPISNIKSNVWELPVLEEPRFVELRGRIFALE